ncbi:MAG: hypothetical protein QOD84_680 [Acidobacteriaceae bacterium]|jgi:hypothetical protein|nr:hypothetical protein [Acidobacteriaceae bacterium]
MSQWTDSAFAKIIKIHGVRWTTIVLVSILVPVGILAQGSPPYPNAITDRLIHQKTPMALPPVNIPFTDPDFGSTIVRVTDETSNFKNPGGYLRTEASGQANMWSADESKFHVIGKGGSEGSEARVAALQPAVDISSVMPICHGAEGTCAFCSTILLGTYGMWRHSMLRTARLVRGRSVLATV